MAATQPATTTTRGGSGGSAADAESGMAQPPSQPQQQPSQQPLPPWSMWEVLGVVTTFRANAERLRLYRASVSVIRFLSVLNLTYTMVGATFLFLAMLPSHQFTLTELQRSQFMKLGVCVSMFSPLALSVDLLALRGLRSWRRGLLLPWLVVYAVMVAFAFGICVTEIVHRGFRWPMMLLAMCSLCVFSAWRHVRVQYAFMALHPAPPTAQSIDRLARVIQENTVDAAAAATAAASEMPAPPPKYEELDAPPPTYGEFVQMPEGPPPTYAEGAAAAAANAAATGGGSK